MKKIITLTAALCITLCLAGCQSQQPPADDVKVNSGASQFEEKLSITWTGNTRMQIESDSFVEQFIEDKFNVDIEAIWASGDKLAAMIASGEIPDIMYMPDQKDWRPLADQGIIAEIPLEMIEQYAPHHYKEVNDEDPRIWSISKYKGLNYAIPKTMGTEYNAVGIWRQDWLERVGIDKVPETLDEYEQAFIKFRNDDPDGDGIKNTYGLTGQGGHAVRQFDQIFGAYGIMPGQWREVEGEIVNSTVMPEAKEALELLNRWYTMELIDPEMLTETPQSSIQKFEAGRYGYLHLSMANYSEHMPLGRSALELWKQRNPDARFVFGPIPEGRDGQRGDWLWGPLGNFVAFSYEIDQQKMIRILQITDALLSNEEYALKVTWGEKGVHYDFNDPEVGAESGLRYLPPYDTDSNKRAELGIGQYGFFNQLQPTSNWALTEITNKYLPTEYKEQSEELANWGKSRDALLRADLPSAAVYVANLDSIKAAAYSNFIIGKRPLSEWDNFVQEWLDKGGRQLTQEAQQFYDENLTQ